MTELVINHTSDQHPWFQRARRARPGSTLRNFYVWSDTDRKYAGTRVIFTDTEASNWTWDPVAKAYYWHRFFSHQPDLNFDNPRVIESVLDVMRFWFEAGVDGMRLDAVPYLCEREGTNNENLPETHAILKVLRAVVQADFPGRVFLAEANQWPEDVRAYFGDGDEAHMCFHFPLMPRMFLALADEDRYPIYDIMRQTPEIPQTAQWAIFLRNHDELTLEMVTDRERELLYGAYASEARARINVGIRRRLAPLMENDRRKIELLNSLLFSMPGTPIVYYGDEIGMGDNIYLGDRDGVRTPMQWTPDRNGGFSRADPARLYLPPNMDTVYGYTAVNVESQTRSASSLLNWMRRLIAVRQAHQVFGRGAIEFLHPGNRKIAAYLRSYEDETVLCVANLSRSPQAVALDLSRYLGRVPVEMLGWSPFPAIDSDRYVLTLPGYAFFWFFLAEEAQSPTWMANVPEKMPEFVTLVLPHGWRSLLDEPARTLLERDVLPAYLPKQRWFGGKTMAIRKVEIVAAEPVAGEDAEVVLVVRVTFDAGEQLYQLPIALAGESVSEFATGVVRTGLARYRTHASSGIIYDAIVSDDFPRRIVAAMRTPPADGALLFTGSEALASSPVVDDESVRGADVEQSNTSAMIGDRFILKTYRRVRPGIHPEIEVARFLDRVGYRNVPPLLGTYALRGGDGREELALGTLQEFLHNRGDAWTMTLNYLERYLDARRATAAAGPDSEPHAEYEGRAAALGAVTADLHRAFASDDRDPAFAPEAVTPADLAAWAQEAQETAIRAFDALAAASATLPPSVRDDALRLASRRDDVLAAIASMLPAAVNATKTRYHGDFHLGQVLVLENGFSIVDFEGEPARPFEERRRKSSPLRDVAGMLRSFNYAAVAALGGLTMQRPEDQSGLEPYAAEWERRVSDGFMQGYVTRIAGTSSYPSDPQHARCLLDLFLLNKAFYEMSYELANRPAWLRIPLQGVRAILDRSPA